MQYLKLITEEVTNRKKSPRKEIEHRVRQGLVLGSLSFLLYINDLPLNIQDAKFVLFADDNNIDAVEEKLIRFIKQLEFWFSNNSLIVNTD